MPRRSDSLPTTLAAARAAITAQREALAAAEKRAIAAEARALRRLEAVAPIRPGVAYPRLIEGARHGPPEDVGGPWGYGEFLEAIADPKHERHKELMEWSGGDFDPQQFDIDAINRRLASLAPRKSIRRKTAKPAAG
jgi:hypothetical protein